jgi:hypothetical protein
VVLFEGVSREKKKTCKQIRKRALTDFILEEGVKKRKEKSRQETMVDAIRSSAF